MLAKNPKAPLGIWFHALSFTTIASELAPTGERGCNSLGFCLKTGRLALIRCMKLSLNPRKTPKTRAFRHLAQPLHYLFQLT
ncbi:hypothetical protein PS874_00419 [Pseudomonas fluorescens]|nr:hypothetical protein PS874_00419 [Pseudomonas fluorescens]